MDLQDRDKFLFMNNQEIHLIGSKYYSFSILSAYLWILSIFFGSILD